MPHRALDLDLSAGEAAASGADGVTWPDEIDQTWIVVRVKEHGEKIAAVEAAQDVHKRVLTSHGSTLRRHEEKHEDARLGMQALDRKISEIAEQVQLNLQHINLTYDEIKAQQAAAATRQVAQHGEIIKRIDADFLRRDYRTVAVVAVIVLAAFVLPFVGWLLGR